MTNRPTGSPGPPPGQSPGGPHVLPAAPSRRILLAGAAAAAAALAGCSTGPAADPGLLATAGTRPPDPTTNPSAPGISVPVAPPAAVPTPASMLAQPGPDVTSGSRSSNVVALTFHGAGDPALTVQALTIAAAAGAHLTVFAVGQWLAGNVALGRQIATAGHDLGNHTWSHQPMTTLSPAAAQVEIQRGADAVAAVLGSPGLLFRPSGTPSSTPVIQAAARAVGYLRCVSYDVDPLDYQDPGADAVRSRTLAAAAGGSIVSLHLGHPGTIDALPGILAGLAARHLTAVTVTELLRQAQ